jgi:predicted ABC-type ATPase
MAERPKPAEGMPDSDEFYYINDAGEKDDTELHGPILRAADFPIDEAIMGPIRERYRAAARIARTKVGDARPWDESKYERGQPENKGQFASKSSSEKSSAKAKGPVRPRAAAVLAKAARGGKDKPMAARPNARPRPKAREVVARADIRETKGAGGKHPGEGYSKDAKLVGDVIYTTNVDDAARALHEDRRVELDQARGVSILLDRLGSIAEKMIARGEKAPVVNLCKLTIAGSNLFCAESKGIPRVQMPQMNAQQTEEFKQHLVNKGYRISNEETHASHLRATQNELNGQKVAKIAQHLRTGKPHEGDNLRTVISNDDYILDGHHRWAAKVGNDSADNNLTNDTKVPVARVDIGITKLLEEAMAFTGGAGAKGMDDTSLSHAADLYTPPTMTPDEIINAVPGAREAVDIVNRKLKAGVSTDKTPEEGGYKNADGTYTPERAQLHKDIVDHFIHPEAVKKYMPEKGANPVLTVLGGRGGSGKSWLTGDEGPVDTEKSMVIDADEVKGMLPEYEGWNAALLHEESSDIVALIDRRAASLGINVTLDGTLKSTNILNRIAVYQDPKESTYDLDGYYMYASPQTAATRAMRRFSAGGTFKGRYVPPEVVLGNTKNEQNFDILSESFRQWAIYDNDGNEGPKLVDESKNRKRKQA